MPTRDPIQHIFGTCAAHILAIAAVILSPLTVGGLIIGLGIGEIEAGTLITVELLVMGITSILVAPLMVRAPHHLLALAGGIFLVSGHALSAWAADLGELYPWRILAGLGCGCLAATVNASIAQARSPVLLYGLAWSAAYTVTAILAVIMTETNQNVTYNIVFGYLAGSLLIFLPLLWFVPKHGAESAPASLPEDSIRTGCILMLGLMVIGLSMMAYYAFLERLAVLIGASPAETGRIVAGAQVAGIVGGLLAAPVAGRFGLLTALNVAIFLHAATITLAVWTSQVIVLGIVAFCEAVLFIIMIPLMLTLAANIDNKGRWAAIAGGIFVLSTALGPIAGATLIEGAGYGGIVWLQWLAAIVSVCIFIYVNRSRAVNH